MATFIKGDPAAPEPDDGTTVVYDSAKNAYVPGPTPGGGGGGGGVTVHGDLTGRSAPDQHPVGAITGLQSALDGKAATGHDHDDRYYTVAEVDTALAGKAGTSHSHPVSDLTATGTPDGTKFLRDDGAWATPEGGGGGGGTVGALTTASPGVILGQAASTDTGGQGIWSALAPNGVIDRSPAAPFSSSDRVSVTPISLPAMTVEALSLRVQTAGAAGATLRFGLYAAGPDDPLGTLLYDSGNMDAATDGYRTAAPAPALTIPAGTYWLALGASDAAVRFAGWEHQYQPRLGGPNVAFRYLTTAIGSWSAGSPLPSTSTLLRTNVACPAPLVWVKAVTP